MAFRRSRPERIDGAAGPAIIQLAVVDQLTILVVKVEIGCADCVEAAGRFLGLVKAKRKVEAKLGGHLSQAVRRIVGIGNCIIRGDRHDSERLPGVIVP